MAAILIFAGGSSYTLHLDFLDAGRVVQGGEVQIAGRQVGSITGVGLTANGLAEVSISIGDAADIPLHRGTRAAIREVGAATIANNFINIFPGPTNQPALPSGATLPTTQTSGIVDLDAVLDSLNPSARASIQGLIANSAQVFAGSGSRYFNDMLLRLDPALGQLGGLTQQVSSDHAQLGGLIRTASIAAAAVASKDADLQAGVANVARTLGAIAAQQNALSDTLDRAPHVLSQAGSTLTDLTTTLTALRPTLREVPPAAAPLTRFLTLITPAASRSSPVVAQLSAQVPALRQSLAEFPALRGPAVKALGSTAVALNRSNHILQGIRYYGSDFILGIFNGLLGISSGNYDKAGHYLHAEFTQSPLLLPGGILGSYLPNLSGLSALSPALFGLRTGLLAKCPGGENPPAPDGSSPWVPNSTICNPADDVPEAVDHPWQP